MMQVDRLRPYIAAGACGIVIVAALAGGALLLGTLSGPGIAGAALLLVLPGALAAHLAARRGTTFAPLKEGALAGLLAGHFAALLQIYTTVAAVLSIDWERYTAQVGPEIANGVHQAVVPLTAILVAISVVVVYLGCVLLALLGAAVYVYLRRLLVKPVEKEDTLLPLGEEGPGK